ncbi:MULTISPECIES: hypothetical protein [unclassified Rhizobium]|jgi:hypothetical protein|uniref:hypothetical protein n=1 Tax=unclassified Rhizobium TaxID=2613769 RepID=UPI000DDAEFB4|nr:hypothetical protein [Rhizobium sp. UBA1881]
MCEHSDDRDVEGVPSRMSSKTQFAEGGNPQSRHVLKQLDVKAEAPEWDDLSLMMVQALEGRA